MLRKRRAYAVEVKIYTHCPILRRSAHEVEQYYLNQVRQSQTLIRNIVVDVVPDVLFVARMDALVLLREKDRNDNDGGQEQGPLQRFHNVPRYTTELELKTG